MRAKSLLRGLGPGLLVAATGIGAGDLATAAFTGSTLGLSVLWAVMLGAFMKFVLNEGLTRWQLATGTTLLDGAIQHLGRPVRWFFLAYLLVWSFFVAAALMSAVGVTCHAIFPLAGTSLDAATTDKVIYGMLHSAVAVVLVRLGGYRLFEKVMSVCVGLMFFSMLATAIALQPDVSQVLRGLFVPRIPAGGTAWTVALIGGIGGTVTVLCYGYWIREVGRATPEALPLCRFDLAMGYLMTATFGIAMVIVGSSLGELEGGGARLVVAIADQLEAAFGSGGWAMRWVFLLGAWSAVFSSLFGVWQSVPYLFADLWGRMFGPKAKLESDGKLESGNTRSTAAGVPIDTNSFAYRGYLYALATLPVAGMWLGSFRNVQQAYAIIGATFVPMLAAVLLVLNGRAAWVGQRYRNSWPTTLVLVGILAFFVYAAIATLGE